MRGLRRADQLPTALSVVYVRGMTNTRPFEIEVTGKTLAEVMRIAADHGQDADRVYLVYGDCGSHEVYLSNGVV